MNLPPSALPRRLLAVGLSGLALALAALPAAASGTRVGFKDAFATARGNAFVATADNPSAIYYNPAGLTQLKGQQVSGTAYFIRIDADYCSAVTGRTSSLQAETQLVPQLFYAWAPENAKWAVGLGYYAPFGLSTDWTGSADLFEFATKNEETFTTINPVLAWQLTDNLAIGGGLTFNRLEVDLRRGLNFSGVAPFGSFRFNADGTDLGWNLGLRWQPAPEHAFGLSYQAAASFGIEGTSDILPLIAGEKATADFAFPDVLILGYSYRPTQAWNLEVNLDWTNWNRFDTVTIAKASGALVLPFNWESSCFYELGATRYLADGWHVSAGYTYSQNSVPDTTWNPAVPDLNRHFWNAGVGRTAGALRWELTVQLATAGTRHVRSGQRTFFGSSPDGAYDSTITSCSLSIDYRF